MPTVATVNSRVKNIIDRLTGLTTTITAGYTSNAGGDSSSSSSSSSSSDYQFTNDIKKLNEQAAADDRKFEEEHSKVGPSGGKTRKQSLQEFVLLLFFVSYGILVVALSLYMQRIGGSVLKIVALMTFMLLMIVAIILRYA